MDSQWLTRVHPSIIQGLVGSSDSLESLYNSLPRNVRLVFAREILKKPEDKDNVLRLAGKAELYKAVQAQNISLHDMLFHLARILDARHIFLCKHKSQARKQATTEASESLLRPLIDVTRLAEQILINASDLQGDIDLQWSTPNILKASFQPLPETSFTHLPILPSLHDILPGEHPSSPRQSYIGIGSGGGSDIISASLLGHLLHPHGKAIDTLVSIRTWLTGSQGKPGSQIGIKREIYNHGGHIIHHGQPVPGTYRITPTTYSEGRDLETVPLRYHKHIIQILDQTPADPSTILSHERATLADQLRATLATHATRDSSIILVDTGGDIFGPGHSLHSTPDQDLRVLSTLSALSTLYPNLTVAILAPGVDTPPHAPSTALAAGAKIYHPTQDERTHLLHVLGEEYRMDGRDEGRFGKTNLALQAAWRGERGWVCLDLPGHVVDTESNPWGCFVWVAEGMGGIVFVRLEELVRVLGERGVLGREEGRGLAVG